MNYQRSQWLLLFAYGCSGCAGLVYQVTWTRLLTLYMGHSTAAVATVVAAFMGGLGVGAVFGGRMSARIPPRRALLIYASLEIAVALAALCLPQTLDLFTPLLAWAYRDGAPGPLFPVVRLIGCFAVLLVPAMALGATFPLAARWVVRHTGSGREGGALYAANTCGAALGASLAGFILLPRFGMLGTTFVGAGAGLLAALAALSVSKLEPAPSAEAEVPAAATPQPSARSPRRQPRAASALAGRPDDTTLAAIVLGLTGLATFTFEITWARTLSQIFGPTTYAFAATVSLLICGLAV
ncbi:MAG: fused MFS/spermidine synthase, partial [Vicinamibacterales bacterium]